MAGKHVEEVLGKESCAVRDRLLEKIAKESAENDRLRAQVNEVKEAYKLMFEVAMNQLDKVEELTREKDSALKAAQKAKKVCDRNKDFRQKVQREYDNLYERSEKRKADFDRILREKEREIMRMASDIEKLKIQNWAIQAETSFKEKIQTWAIEQKSSLH